MVDFWCRHLPSILLELIYSGNEEGVLAEQGGYGMYYLIKSPWGYWREVHHYPSADIEVSGTTHSV